MLPLISLVASLVTGKEFIKAIKTHVSEGVDVSSVSPQALPGSGSSVDLPPRA